MKATTLIRLLFVAVMMSTLSGCVAFTIGTKTRAVQPVTNPAAVNFALAAVAYEPYDGDILRIGLFDYCKNPDEIVSVDVWPIFGFAVGIVGIRLRVIPIDFGIGVLGYNPYPSIVPVAPVVPVTPAPVVPAPPPGYSSPPPAG